MPKGQVLRWYSCVQLNTNIFTHVVWEGFIFTFFLNLLNDISKIANCLSIFICAKINEYVYQRYKHAFEEHGLFTSNLKKLPVERISYQMEKGSSVRIRYNVFLHTQFLQIKMQVSLKLKYKSWIAIYYTPTKYFLRYVWMCDS